MLDNARGERGRSGKNDVTDSARWKVVVRVRRDVTDGARGKVSVGRDVMLQTVQRANGAVRERRDITESARWKGDRWRERQNMQGGNVSGET